MTDWTKAREAAISNLGSMVYGYTDKDATPNNWSRSEDALDAALSTLKAHGFMVVPREATIGMISAMADVNAKHSGYATPAQEYRAMIAAAEKERE